MTVRSLWIVAVAVLLAVPVVAVAADEMGDLHKLEGEVLMLTPVSMQIGTMEGGIEDLAITESSDLDQSVNRGDWVEVWYRLDQDQSKVIVRSARSTSAGTATGESGEKAAAESGGERSSKTEMETGRSPESTRSERSMTQEPESAATARERSLGTNKVLIGRPGRATLPQTASSRPLIGLLGLAALVGAIAALTLGRGRV